jgi:predicted DNA binding CopG/RHH family protein
MYILSFIANIFKTATGSLWRFCHPDLVKKVLDTALVRAPCTARNGYAMNKKLKSIPKFRSEAEERRFWETHDSSDFIDWTKAQRLRFPNLKPSTTAISLRLPVTLLERIKVAANKRDVPYQSLIKPGLQKRRERDDD